MYKNKAIQTQFKYFKLTLFILMLVFGYLAISESWSREDNHLSIRLTHAKEIMGKNYQKSVVNLGNQRVNLEEFVYRMVKESLSSRWKPSYVRIARTIMNQSRIHHLDPIFLLAVIGNESGFRPDIVGSAGEIGLMQIRPNTAEWIAKNAKLKWKGKKSLFDPVINIELGSAYLIHLKGKFKSKSQLYLAAYNMGPKNVYRNLSKQIVPDIYPGRVMKKYLYFYAKLNEKPKQSLSRLNRLGA